MIILSKLADYGVIVATHLAAHPDRLPPGARAGADLGRRGRRRDRWRYRHDAMLDPRLGLHAHDLLPDPAALGGDQSRSRAGTVGGLARRDAHPGRFRLPDLLLIHSVPA